MLIKDQRSPLIKAGPDDGLAEGEFIAYASVFGNRDSYGDVVVPGAFTDTLAAWAEKGDPVPLLFGHNMSDPDFNIGEIVKAEEDDTGLKVHARLDLQASKALQTYRLIKGRRINQMSFAYDVLDGAEAHREREDGSKEWFYELRKLKLYEVSVVTLGANQETEILAVKSASLAAQRFAEDLKAGRMLSAKNESEIRAAHEALDRVLVALDGTTDEEKASGTGPSRKAGDDHAGSREASSEPSVGLSAQEKAAVREREIAAHIR